jgi:hypothetical protein
MMVPMVAITLILFTAATDRFVGVMGWEVPEWLRWRESSGATLRRLIDKLPGGLQEP